MEAKVHADASKLESIPGYADSILYDSAGFLLKRALQRSRKFHSENWQDLDLTGMQTAAIMVIFNLGPINQVVLGRSIEMEPSNIHGLVQRLLKKKLIVLRHDRRDARANLINLTPLGRKYAKLMFERTSKSDARFLSVLNSKEQKIFRQLLTKLIDQDEQPGA